MATIHPLPYKAATSQKASVLILDFATLGRNRSPALKSFASAMDAQHLLSNKRNRKSNKSEAEETSSAAKQWSQQDQNGNRIPVLDRKKQKKKKKGRNGNADGDLQEAVIKEEQVKSSGVGGKKRKADKDGGSVGARKDPGRHYTVTIAVAGSMIDNAQSLELATVLAGQIARAAAIFRVDEIVVFDDGDANLSARNRRWSYSGSREETGGVFLARLLRYLETPQYLRKALFPMHASLRFAGLLPPLDTPHHARKHELVAYREGVVLAKQAGEAGCSVDVGLGKEVVVRQPLSAGTRVTVAMGEKGKSLSNMLDTVPSCAPREETGVYWGYSVRHVDRLSAIFTDCPFPGGGYDYRIGTSEHGSKEQASTFTIPRFRHLMVVFGGPPGLEESKALDRSLTCDNVASLFDCYVNVCASQGSRTIRTEEAVLICLQFLQDPISRAVDAV